MDPLKVPASQESKLHFLDYWRIIRIRKTVILAVFLLVVITATLVTFILPESYASTARIKIERDNPDISPLAERPMGGGYDPYFIQTEFETIQSEKVLGKVVEAQGLNKTWGEKFRGQGETLKTPEAVTMLKGRMDLRPVRNTSFIEIKVFSDNATEAAELANAVAKAYKEFRTEQRQELYASGIKAVQDRLEDQELEVRKATEEVEKLRDKLQVADTLAMENQPTMLLSAETLHRIEQVRIETQTELVRQQTLLNKLKGLKRDELTQ